MSGEEKKFYVYALLDMRYEGPYIYPGVEYKFPFLPYYIGKGRGFRYLAHFTDSELKKNSPKNNKIKKLNKLGYPPCSIKIYEGFDEESALSTEINIITHIGRVSEGGPLTNLTLGGEGMSGLSPSEETRKKISIANTGIVKSEETRKKLSIANTGKKHSEERKKQNSDFRKGVPLSESTKKKLSEAGIGRVVLQETRDKISSAQIGKFVSLETRAKMSVAAKDKNVTPETKNKLSMVRIKFQYRIETNTGDIVTIFSLSKFCRSLGLQPQTLSKTIIGHTYFQSLHKGFRIVDKITLPSAWYLLPALLSMFNEENAKYGKE